jgi:branched-chain amino acid transport system substrate-binding protein
MTMGCAAEHDTGAVKRESEAEGRLRLGAPLSLSGRYAFLGRLAAGGLRALVRDTRGRGELRTSARRLVPQLRLVDDGGTREGVRRGLDALAEADLLIGPYGSDLVGEAARWAAQHGRLLWNHGGSDDSVQRLPGVASIPSPASRYFAPVLEALADPMPGARILVAAGGGRFGGAIAEGVRDAAGRVGMEVVGSVAPGEATDVSGADVLLLAGTFAEDVAALRRLRRRPGAVAAVGAGMSIFRTALGPQADGVLGPSQWEEGVRYPYVVDVGPRQADAVQSLRAEAVPEIQVGPGHVDYPAAQAYAAGLIAMRCVEGVGGPNERALLEAAGRLRCTTFFGRFGLGEDGRQRDHDVLAVQWQEGVKRVVGPSHLAEVPVAV